MAAVQVDLVPVSVLSGMVVFVLWFLGPRSLAWASHLWPVVTIVDLKEFLSVLCRVQLVGFTVQTYLQYAETASTSHFLSDLTLSFVCDVTLVL